jgi:hypothetical protein
MKYLPVMSAGMPDCTIISIRRTPGHISGTPDLGNYCTTTIRRARPLSVIYLETLEIKLLICLTDAARVGVIGQGIEVLETLFPLPRIYCTVVCILAWRRSMALPDVHAVNLIN